MTASPESTSLPDLDEILEAKRRYGWVLLFADESRNPSIGGPWGDIKEQSLEDLKHLFNRTKDKATCWGPVCGIDGLFAFDFDHAWVYRLWSNQFKDRAETLTSRTPNGGARAYYKVSNPTTNDDFKSSLHVELKGTGRFVAFGGTALREDGSIGEYETERNLPIKEDSMIVEDSVKFFQGLLEKRYRWLNYNCIKKRFEKKRFELSHEQRLAIRNFMLIDKSEDWEIHNLFLDQLDYEANKTEAQIRDGYEFFEKGGKPYPCAKLKTIFSISDKDCGGCARRVPQPKEEKKEEEKRRQHFLPFIELPDGRLAEEFFDGKEVGFLVYDPKTSEIKKLKEIELEDFILKPIDNDEVRDHTILLPSEAVEYESEEQLTKEIREYLDRWHEPPDQLPRLLDVYYCYLTYVKDLIPQLPYRRYLAPWGRGKSAWIETLGWICYRGIVLAGSDTDKSVVRKLNNWKGTALIDEADFGDSTLYAFLTKILNIGYDRKTGFYHRSDDNDPNKILSYCVFGPKLLATREKYKDLALESRCLTTIGRQNIRQIPLFRMAKFLEESQVIRNKLILWRFRKYYEIKEKAAQLEDKGIASKVYDGADNISSRVKQVILPLWLIAGDSMKTTLTDMAKTFDDLLKIEDPDYLLQLQAKDAIQKIIKDSEEKGEHRNEENILYEDPAKEPVYVFPLNQISRTVLIGRGAKEDEITVSDVTSTSKSLKNIFESTLGFKVRIGKKKRREVLVPPSWLKEEKPEEESKKGLEKFFDGAPLL